MLRERALARLRTAMNYWIATTRPDGRPHAAPVWGVWLDDGSGSGPRDRRSATSRCSPTPWCTSTARTT
ncbi:MAG: pyridoxamine 5'-phosphate oxidase family protein [Chloroflexota bacterium]